MTEAVPAAVDVPVYKYRATLGRDLDKRIRRYAARRGLEYKEVNWGVNQHMGITKRSQATIKQLKDGIELVARWERGN